MTRTNPGLQGFRHVRARLALIQFHLRNANALIAAQPWATDADTEHAQFERELHYAQEEVENLLRWLDGTTGRPEG